MNYLDTQYINADSLIAEVKEEMKSYFESGAVTDIMLPTYIDQCLRKIGWSALKPETAVVFIENYKGTFPNDFYLLDYAITYDRHSVANRTFGSFPSTVGFWSKSIECTNCPEDCDPKYEVFEKITCQPNVSVKYELTRPQWIRVYYGSRDLCVNNCRNLSIQSDDIITIHEHKTVSATFQKGTVFIKYMSRPMDDNGVPMVPEIMELEEYIKSHIKFKLFEQLWNSVVDETFKQIETKFQYYKQDSLNKLQAARAVLIRPSKQEVNDSIVKQHKRFIKYNIR